MFSVTIVVRPAGALAYPKGTLGAPCPPARSPHLRWKMWEQGRACSRLFLSPMDSPHRPQ